MPIATRHQTTAGRARRRPMTTEEFLGYLTAHPATTGLGRSLKAALVATPTH